MWYSAFLRCGCFLLPSERPRPHVVQNMSAGMFGTCYIHASGVACDATNVMVNLPFIQTRCVEHVRSNVSNMHQNIFPGCVAEPMESFLMEQLANKKTCGVCVFWGSLIDEVLLLSTYRQATTSSKVKIITHLEITYGYSF